MRRIRYILITCLAVSCTFAHKQRRPVVSKADVQILKNIFAEWQKNEIKKKLFWANDSCNPDWIILHPTDTSGIVWSFPDNTSFKFSYADINNDGKIDQLVTFTPEQCDGGNGSMWTQIEVLTISNHNQYTTTSTLSDGNFSYLGKDTSGFYWFDSIGVNKIYGRYLKFKNTDGHCCPSIIKPEILDYDTNKVLYLGKYYL